MVTLQLQSLLGITITIMGLVQLFQNMILFTFKHLNTL